MSWLDSLRALLTVIGLPEVAVASLHNHCCSEGGEPSLLRSVNRLAVALCRSMLDLQQSCCLQLQRIPPYSLCKPSATSVHARLLYACNILALIESPNNSRVDKPVAGGANTCVRKRFGREALQGQQPGTSASLITFSNLRECGNMDEHTPVSWSSTGWSDPPEGVRATPCRGALRGSAFHCSVLLPWRGARNSQHRCLIIQLAPAQTV